MTKETSGAICNICGQPYGSCDMAVHRKKIKETDPRYDFGEETVETPYHKASISPKVSQPRRSADGREVADVNVVTFGKKK